MEVNNNLLAEKKSKHYAVKSTAEMKLAVQDIDSAGRVVTGFFNTFNYLDSDNDVLLVGSAKRSIRERGATSNATAKIKHALFHDLTRLAGKIQVLEEREVKGITGIYFETKMSDTVEGNDTLKNYLEGVYDNHSIGFQYLEVETVKMDNVKKWDAVIGGLMNPKDAKDLEEIYLIKDIKLYEGSTVSFGANQLTPFLGIKSGNKEALKIALQTKTMQLRKQLTSGTQSDDMMQTFELQLLQLDQMIDELVTQIPFAKVSAGQTETKNAEPLVKSINYDYLLKNIK